MNTTHRLHHLTGIIVITFAAGGVILSPGPATAAPQLKELVGTDSPAAVAPVDKERVIEVIDDLDTAQRTSRGTYDRTEQYGEWSSNEGSADESFCGSTREDIRYRDLSDVQLKPDDSCAVQSGVLEYDPYTGDKVNFERTANPALEVEHIIPVELHYDMIGYGLTQEEREEFNDDAENLILVDSSANGSKGSDGPAEWLVPDNPGYACTYIARFSYIADKYSMPVDPEDKRAMAKGLDDCDNTATAAPADTAGDTTNESGNPVMMLLREHPLAMAVVVGVIIAALMLMTRSGKRRGHRGGGVSKAVRRSRRIRSEIKRWGL